MPIPAKVTIAALVTPVVAVAGVVAGTGATADRAKPAGARAAAQNEQIPFPALVHLPHYPLTPVQPSPKPVRLTGKGKPLKVSYTHNGARRTLSDFLRRSSTLSFVVLRGNEVVDERYFEGQGPTSRFNTWSVGESITAAALGVALREGRIHAIGDPVTQPVMDRAHPG